MYCAQPLEPEGSTFPEAFNQFPEQPVLIYPLGQFTEIVVHPPTPVYPPLLAVVCDMLQPEIPDEGQELWQFVPMHTCEQVPEVSHLVSVKEGMLVQLHPELP